FVLRLLAPETAEAGAIGTGALRAVEREQLRRDLGIRNAALEADRFPAEDEIFMLAIGINDGRFDNFLAVARSDFQRIGEALLDSRPGAEPVDPQLDGGGLLFRRAVLPQLEDFAVDANAGEARAREPVELGLEIIRRHRDRREHEQLASHRQRHETVDDLLDRERGDFRAALPAMRLADPRVEKPEKIVNLSQRADGRARASARALLLNGDRG